MALILIVAHAPLASALVSAAAHVFAEKAGTVVAVDVQPADTFDTVDAAVGRVLAEHPGQEALMLTDVFGATPCNGAMRHADGLRVRLVAGVNVPMLWRALCYSDEPLDRLVTRAVEGATMGVMQLSASRRQNQPSILPCHDPVDPHHQQ